MNNLEKAEQIRIKYLQECENLIIDEVKRIMRIHKNLVEYSDCMGCKAFTDKKGEPVFLIESKGMNSSYNYVYGDTYKTFSILNDIYYELDCSSLGITVKADENSKQISHNLRS